MAEINWGILAPIVIYFLIMNLIGLYSSRLMSKSLDKEGNYIGQFLVGGRNTGGFVLAMTLVATYLSAGSFIGGPGTAYTYGLSWVFLSMAQMPTGYFTLSVLGKKFAIVSRKIEAHTITDFLRIRYKSRAVTLLASLSIIFFLIAAMAAQWIGAARLLQGATGISYRVALIFFGMTVVIHTAIAGYRGVVINDLVQGIVMTIASLILFITVVVKGGGIGPMVASMKAIDPGLISPFGPEGRELGKAYISSFWVLVGFATIGLPSVAQKAMSYRDSKSLHRGIKTGTLVSIVIILGMHLVGAFGITLMSGLQTGDLLIPSLTVSLFPNILAGIILAGPLAAVMSTVDSQLLIVVGAIVNDLTLNYIRPDLREDEKKLGRRAKAWSLILGLIIYLVAKNPPELMVWLNLFATAGQLSAFLWPTILGLYWKKANKEGALASMLVGLVSYIIFNNMEVGILGLHAIVPSLFLSLLAFLVVAEFTERPDRETIELFWGL